jgi:hypothetical protein
MPRTSGARGLNCAPRRPGVLKDISKYCYPFEFVSIILSNGFYVVRTNSY